jgi:hypothetical protein
MGKIPQGILGGFSGKVGNIIGASWKGIAVIKARPLSVANPKTAGQVMQRGKMKALVAFARLILAVIIKPLNDRFASKESGYNKFVSQNMQAVNSTGVIDSTKLIIATGKMQAPIMTIASTGQTTGTLLCAAQPNDTYALPTDKFYGIVINPTTLAIQAIISGNFTRTQLATAQTFTGTGFGVTLHITGAWLRADGSVVSNSAYA